MKPAPFEYHAPTELEQALALMSEYGSSAKVLAGGQSLLPMLNQRLIRPQHIVDINRVQELSCVHSTLGGLRVGATARQSQVEHDPAADAATPLIPQTLGLVGRWAIRNRGTVVGSLVQADPAAELPCLFALLGGTVQIARCGSEREVDAQSFFLGPGLCCIEPNEIATAARLPALPPGTGTWFEEISPRQGDLPLSAAAALVVPDRAGRIRAARVALAACGPVPIVVDLTSSLAGADIHAAPYREAAHLVRTEINPVTDIHADAHYRRHLAEVLAFRALRLASAQCRPADTAGETPP